MNLGFDRWIPVTGRDCRLRKVSLCEAFQSGEDLADLAVRPDERVAVMRLLIAIAQAALDGPKDRADWQQCRGRLPEAVKCYLAKWRTAFELFGPGPRFLQLPVEVQKHVDEEQESGGVATSKLDLALATGNNDTLFDNAGGYVRPLGREDLALRLLTFQCFSPGGRIGVARWQGQSTPGNGSSNHAPCLQSSMVHAYIRGETLLGTIHFNLLTRDLVSRVYGEDRWGRPIWEWMPAGFDDEAAIRNATATYLGRLVPLSRAIWLDEGGAWMVLANGLTYPAFGEAGGGPREAAATVIEKKKGDRDEYGVLSLSPDKAIWRELHALAVKRHSGHRGGPLALENLDDDTACDLWAGGLAADQAKPLDLVESVFHIPAAMLLDTGQRVYEEGVRLAEEAAKRLEAALHNYSKDLVDGANRAVRVDIASLRARVRSHYWTAVEQDLDELLDAAANPAQIAAKGWKNTEWAETLQKAAREAFQLSCPRSTVRQLKAYVRAEAAMNRQLARLFFSTGGVNDERTGSDT